MDASVVWRRSGRSDRGSVGMVLPLGSDGDERVRRAEQGRSLDSEERDPSGWTRCVRWFVPKILGGEEGAISPDRLSVPRSLPDPRKNTLLPRISTNRGYAEVLRRALRMRSGDQAEEAEGADAR